ncbi:unnamed protein product [Gongylonema pulchrum]|uniref:Uncharacterized protein n=1 Tax=Gongylonema pulchrum TaxID=637853 RepID=A0A183DGU8_9BILA|nr:unnamed protein product [Gongylonema pulchrum]
MILSPTCPTPLSRIILFFLSLLQAIIQTAVAATSIAQQRFPNLQMAVDLEMQASGSGNGKPEFSGIFGKICYLQMGLMIFSILSAVGLCAISAILYFYSGNVALYACVAIIGVVAAIIAILADSSYALFLHIIVQVREIFGFATVWIALKLKSEDKTFLIPHIL